MTGDLTDRGVNGGGTVERWSGGAVERWRGGAVERNDGGLPVCWIPAKEGGKSTGVEFRVLLSYPVDLKRLNVGLAPVLVNTSLEQANS